MRVPMLPGTRVFVLLVSVLHFFFSSRRRHTRSYGDWSSDVCSSDLWIEGHETVRLHALLSRPRDRRTLHPGGPPLPRSEERRVGKECRSRLWQAHYKKRSRVGNSRTVS